MKQGRPLTTIVFAAIFAASCSVPGSADVRVAEGPLNYFHPNKESGVQKSDLFVFVGEKIEVVEILPTDGEMWLDQGFNAKYRVVESVYGEFDGGVIEFRVWDHYGYPRFAKFPHALLFVSRHEGSLYHEKYRYYTVHQTIDGRWAACGDPYARVPVHRKPFDPKPLPFSEPVTFSLNNYRKEWVDAFFVPPYFEIVDGKAVCKMGAYVDELFQIERDGVLKAWGVGQP